MDYSENNAQLFAALANESSPRKKQRIVAQILRSNMALVGHVINSLHYVPAGSYEEVLQEGSIGLFKAINNFDLSKGAFASFAITWIRGEIQHFLRDRHSMIRTPRLYVDNRRRFMKMMRENRDPVEIHRATRIPVHEQGRALKALTEGVVVYPIREEITAERA